MPRTKRSALEFESAKNNILDEALLLISKDGYDGFSMRKLANRLGIAAKTIYNYFQNKDEIYLTTLIRGFGQLYQTCSAAQQAYDNPVDQLRAMSLAYLDFGLTNPNLYNLMFTWVVPKFKDYIRTPMEPIARTELESAQKIPALFARSILDCSKYTNPAAPIDTDTAQFLVIMLWTRAHGFVAGINNTMLDYMISSPVALKQRLLDETMEDLLIKLK